MAAIYNPYGDLFRDRYDQEMARHQAMGLAQQAGLGGLGGLGQFASGRSDIPATPIHKKREPKNIRETLQAETDEWLDFK